MNFREILYWGFLLISVEKNPNLLKIGEKYRALCMKTQIIPFIVASDNVIIRVLFKCNDIRLFRQSKRYKR